MGGIIDVLLTDDGLQFSERIKFLVKPLPMFNLL
ncbi:MAG: hypothetical protein JWR26_1489 [Pedosphaera sp.]|nr:hypothetical protein [Pedosphaera sp.]